MTRDQKIKLLLKIKAGELPASVLNVETGEYLPTERPGIYRHSTGYEIGYLELLKLAEPLSFLISATFISNDQEPYRIMVSEFAAPWIEGKRYAEIKVTDTITVENLMKL